MTTTRFYKQRLTETRLTYSSVVTALAFVIFAIPELAVAQAQRCSGLFDKESTVLNELVQLRVEVDRQRSEGNQALAKLLYVEYQNRYLEAKNLGAGVLKIDHRVQFVRDRFSEQILEKKKQTDQVIAREKAGLMIWSPKQTIATASAPHPGKTIVSLSADGKSLFHATGNQTIERRNLGTGQSSSRFLNRLDAVESVITNSQETLLAVYGELNLVGTYEILKIRSKSKSSVLLEGESLTFSPDGKLIAIFYSAEDVVNIYDAKTFNLKRALPTFSKEIPKLEFSGDSRSLFVLEGTFGLRRADMKSGEFNLEYPVERPSAMTNAKGNSTLAIASGRTHKIEIYQDGKQKPVAELVGAKSEIKQLAMSNDGSRTLALTNDGSIFTWETLSGSLINETRGRAGSSISVSQDFSVFAELSAGGSNGGSSGEIRIFDFK